MPSEASSLTQLARVIADRKERLPPKSYTTQLFERGVVAIVAKVREETEELIEAVEKRASEGDLADKETAARKQQVVHEAADLFYHLLVLLTESGVSLEEVDLELGKRFGTSGLEEKASRNRGGA